MRLLLALILLLPLPALAQLQFDTAPAPVDTGMVPPGVAWLQNKPMTLFDLGMMELTNAANQLVSSMPEVRGAVAEFQNEKGLIAVSFYAALPYSKEACSKMAMQLRDALFLQRKDPDKLERELASYFISYGPIDPTRPRSIGRELRQIMRVTVYQQEGACQLPLTNDDIVHWQDELPASDKPAASTSKP